MDTVEINRQINPFNLSCAVFAPFQGTALRTLAEKRGYIDSDLVSPHNGHISSMTMPNFTKDEIFGLQRCFVMYVRFPKKRWPEIKNAEALTPEGDAIWESLRDEFLDTYWEKATLSPEPVFEKVNN